MKKATRYSPEVRERAVRPVQEQVREHASAWAAIVSMAENVCCSPETLRKPMTRSGLRFHCHDE